MIGFIQGEVLESGDGKVIVGVGDKEKGQVGYIVSVPLSPEYGGIEAGQFVSFSVYTHIREEAFDLYGFFSKTEKELFLTLLGVNGIGPRSALGILSAVETSQLVEAILHSDQALLTRIPGIGKKTAERMVVELRDPIRKKWESGALGSSAKTQSPSKKAADASYPKRVDPSLFRDAKDALMGLGYRENEIQQVMKRVLEESERPFQKPEELIRTVLQQMN